MKIKLKFLLFFLFPMLCFAQNTWHLDTVLEAENVTQVYTDHFNNVYTVTQSTLKKYDATGKYLKQYNNPGLGNITYINTFNPLNILVYFKDYNQFVFLDNYLNPNLNLFTPANFGFYDVQFASTVDQNSVWFYNQVDDKLRLWSLTENKVLNATLQISQITSVTGRPHYIWSSIKNVYLIYPETGILVFDNFGGFQKIIPIRGIEKIFLTDVNLVFIENQNIVAFNSFTKQETSAALPILESEDVWLSQDQLVILKEGKVYLYRSF